MSDYIALEIHGKNMFWLCGMFLIIFKVNSLKQYKITFDVTIAGKRNTSIKFLCKKANSLINIILLVGIRGF